MPGTGFLTRLRIRDAGNTGDILVITSVRGGTNPYIVGIPRGDGSNFDPKSGLSYVGSYTIQIGDWPIGGQQRILTANLEDGNGQPLLGYRRAIIESSIDGGGTWQTLVSGVITLLRLISGITWEMTVGDPMRAQAGVMSFAVTPTQTLITDFLTTWPMRGCILGGPIKGGPFCGQVDLGGWLMRVEGHGQLYLLKPVNVYGAPDYSPTHGHISDYADGINKALSPYGFFADADLNGSSFDTVYDAQKNGGNGLVVLVNGVPFRPLAPYFFPTIPRNYDANNPFVFVSTYKGNEGIVILQDNQTPLVDGALVRVRALTVLPSPISPLYFKMHPIDLLTTLLTQAGLAFNSATCATMKADARLGADLLVAGRVLAAISLSDMVTRYIAPFGIGLRGDTSGQIEPFFTREFVNTTPILTIGAADVVQGTTRLVYELDTAQGLQTFNFRQKIFTRQVVSLDQSPDGIVESENKYELLNGDATALPFGSTDCQFEGMITRGRSIYPVNIDYPTAIAQTMFDRFGHGAIALETTFRRGGAGDGTNLGDELLVNLPQLPNHNYRLGDNNAIAARAMQIVRRTVTPTGYEVRLLDAGANAQPLATTPTLSVTASTDAPRTVALCQITNAAALLALGYSVRLLWAVTSGGAPSADAYTLFRTFPFPLTGPFRLPAVQSGSAVYVIARSEKLGARPSNYGAAAHVVLSAIDDPTSVVAATVSPDGSQVSVSWVPGTNAGSDLTDVYVRDNGTSFPAAALKQFAMVPGATQAVIRGLTPNTIYIVTVQHRDPISGDVSDPVDASVTTSSTFLNLATPIRPEGFSGSIDPITGQPVPDGTYGILVMATVIPGFVEVAEAVETAPGSGTFGSFATVTATPVPSVNGTWTRWQRIAPNDGKRRHLKARHVATGTVSSVYTDIVEVLPWSSVFSVGLDAYVPPGGWIEVTATPAGSTRDAAYNIQTINNSAGPTQQFFAVSLAGLPEGAIIDSIDVSTFFSNGIGAPANVNLSLARQTGHAVATVVTVAATASGVFHTETMVPSPEEATRGNAYQVIAQVVGGVAASAAFGNVVVHYHVNTVATAGVFNV